MVAPAIVKQFGYWRRRQVAPSVQFQLGWIACLLSTRTIRVPRLCRVGLGHETGLAHFGAPHGCQHVRTLRQWAALPDPQRSKEVSHVRERTFESSLAGNRGGSVQRTESGTDFETGCRA